MWLLVAGGCPSQVQINVKCHVLKKVVGLRRWMFKKVQLYMLKIYHLSDFSVIFLSMEEVNYCSN